MGDASNATNEQSAGIGQVENSVSQLNQVTQQNAALVEQSAAAADSLRHQAAALAEVVSVFKLSPGAGRPESFPAQGSSNLQVAGRQRLVPMYGPKDVVE